MQNGTSRAKPDDEQIFRGRVHPEDWENPEPRSGYDFAIVGAGPAGLAAANPLHSSDFQSYSSNAIAWAAIR